MSTGSFKLLLRCLPAALLALVPMAPALGQEIGPAGRIIDEHIVPAYERMMSSAGELDINAQAFCQRPGEQGLTALRTSFNHAMDAWQRVQYIQFGPIREELRYNRIQIWPDKRGSIGKHITRLIDRGDPEALEADRFAQGSIAVQGLSALEHLLFGDGVSAADFGGDKITDYRCQLVQAITANLLGIASDIVNGWTGGEGAHRARYTSAPQIEDGEDPQRRLDIAILNNLYAQLLLINGYKLERPLGASLEKARGKRAESWRSGRSLRNIELNLKSLHELYREGFADRLPDETLKADIEGAFARIASLVDQANDPLSAAVQDPTQRDLLVSLKAEIQVLRKLFTGAVSQQLDIPIGFNALDGD